MMKRNRMLGLTPIIVAKFCPIYNHLERHSAPTDTSTSPQLVCQRQSERPAWTMDDRRRSLAHCVRQTGLLLAVLSKPRAAPRRFEARKGEIRERADDGRWTMDNGP